jgi:WD40 repeat protein
MLLLLAVAVAGVPTWESDIAPLFDQHCSGCHAAAVTMGSLNLETYEGVRKGGNHGTIVVPGSPRESRLYTMLRGEAAPAMPMDGKVLPAAKIEMVGAWIAAGARGPAAAGAGAAVRAVAAADTGAAPRTRSQSYSLAWYPSGAYAAVGGFKKVSFVAGTRPELTGMADAVRAVAFSRNGQLLAAAGGLCGRKGEVKIFALTDSGEATLQASVAGHSDCIYAAAFSSSGKTLATASYDKLIKIWDVATGAEVRTLKDHIDAVYALAFTPDGKRLVSGAADRTIKLWDPDTGERLFTMGEPADSIHSVDVSPDGRYVAAGGADKSIRVWRLNDRTAEMTASQIAHEDAIVKVAFSRDGARIVTAAADRTMKVFATRDLAEIQTLPKTTEWVTGLEFSPDGKRLAITCLDGNTQILSLEAK